MCPPGAGDKLLAKLWPRLYPGNEAGVAAGRGVSASGWSLGRRSSLPRARCSSRNASSAAETPFFCDGGEIDSEIPPNGIWRTVTAGEEQGREGELARSAQKNFGKSFASEFSRVDVRAVDRTPDSTGRIRRGINYAKDPSSGFSGEVFCNPAFLVAQKHLLTQIFAIFTVSFSLRSTSTFIKGKGVREATS